MSDQPKKQELPPKEENETDWDYAARLYSSRVCTLMRNDKDCDLAEYKAATHIQMELLAALSDNEAKDARIAELEADKKALKTADELNRQECSHWVSRYNNALHRSEAAEAKLKSVEGLLEEKLERWYSSMHNGFAYTHISVDALLARIREAVKGDKS